MPEPEPVPAGDGEGNAEPEPQRRAGEAAAVCTQEAREARLDQQVLRASMQLRTGRVPRLVQELDSLAHLPLDSEALSALLHARGAELGEATAQKLLGLTCRSP